MNILSIAVRRARSAELDVDQCLRTYVERRRQGSFIDDARLDLVGTLILEGNLENKAHYELRGEELWLVSDEYSFLLGEPKSIREALRLL